MYPLSQSPVKEVTFGQALKLSLDNYYDVLKTQVGGLGTEEYLQLKLVADPVDLSDKRASESGYKWFSYYNLLNRSDLSIMPEPVAGGVQTAVAEFADVYGIFLRRLRHFVVKKNLSQEDQKAIADIDVTLASLKKEMMEFAVLDRTNWKNYAEAMGFDVGDMTAYVQWSGIYGHLREIEQRVRAIRASEFDKKTILDKQYPDPDDRAIVDAEAAFENPVTRLRYPIFPDFEYPNGDEFNVQYLALLPLGSTALFDDRRVVTWNMTIPNIKSNAAGAMSASLDNSTSESKTITTDWKASASARYGFIKVKANASDHRRIQEDFDKGTKVTIGSKASFKVQIKFGPWFDDSLFEHKRVKENIYDFEEFFGEKGSLLYYPKALILVRGFNVEFQSTQKWVYDYKRKFSVSGGGGFNAFGINFGGSASYSKNVHEHKVDQSDTSLKISDDDETIRFVGYTVKKNTVYSDVVDSLLDRDVRSLDG